MPPPMPTKPITQADIDVVLEQKRKHAQAAEGGRTGPRGKNSTLSALCLQGIDGGQAEGLEPPPSPVHTRSVRARGHGCMDQKKGAGELAIHSNSICKLEIRRVFNLATIAGSVPTGVPTTMTLA